MTVSELIEFLKKQPQDIRVAYERFSEQALLEGGDIRIVSRCKPRPDGWIQDERPDMESEEYLLFLGN